MSVDIRTIATIIYMVVIILTLKNSEGVYDFGPIFLLPFWTLIYAVFWIIWLNFN